MNTTVNVLGIQAKNILENIGTTLKAVTRSGKENKQIQIIQANHREEELRLYTVKDPVFQEDRLTKEIPEANWTGHKQVLIFNGWFDPGVRQASVLPSIQPNAHGGVVPTNRLKTRIQLAKAQQQTVVAFPQKESGQASKWREVRSSLSPPPG